MEFLYTLTLAGDTDVPKQIRYAAAFSVQRTQTHCVVVDRHVCLYSHHPDNRRR